MKLIFASVATAAITVAAPAKADILDITVDGRMTSGAFAGFSVTVTYTFDTSIAGIVHGSGLLEPIGNIPPAEAEERYYAMLEQPAMAA
jgi:ABC-type uncharacterized transport system permease subunit